MNPVSTATGPDGSSISTVFAWPPRRSSASYTTTSSARESDQAAPSPATPLPTTATLDIPWIISEQAGSEGLKAMRTAQSGWYGPFTRQWRYENKPNGAVPGAPAGAPSHG